MCIDALDKLSVLWEIGDDLDRQGMARTLFSYIVYDLDTRRITDFQLKPWADRFLVLREALYENEETAARSYDLDTKVEADEEIPGASAPYHIHVLLSWLYGGSAPSDTPLNDNVTKTERNQEIYRRYQSGISPSVLAKEYGVSEQRIYVLIRGHRSSNEHDDK